MSDAVAGASVPVLPAPSHSDLIFGLFRDAAAGAGIPNLPSPTTDLGSSPVPIGLASAESAAPGMILTRTPVSPAVDSAPLYPPPVHADSVSLNAADSHIPTNFVASGSETLQVLQESGFATETLGTHPVASESYYFLSASEKSIPADHSVSRNFQQPVPTFDIEGVRQDFPALQQRMHGHPLIYLDNAATTQKPRAVIDAVSHFYSRDNAPVHRAAYELAERATAEFEAAREKVREFLGAKDKKEIVFTRGTTEAINLVAQSFGRKHVAEGDEILLTELEHHANIVPWQLLAEQTGAVLKVVPINDRGELILEEFAKLLGPRTKLVSVAHVSNALGTVNPIEQIIPLAHAKGALVLIDGAQSTPHIPVNVQALDADFFVFSGHKIFGPTGIGALYGKAHLLESLPPWQGGGHMIKDVRFEKTIYQNAPEKFEAGTPDISGAVGLGAAIDYLHKIGLPAIAAYEHSLLEYAAQLLQGIPGLRLIGTAANKASVLSFVLAGHANETIAKHLDHKGIAVRAGHHCALPAHRHFGLESTVRPSLAFYNTKSDVDALVQAIRSLIKT
ncbi:MAG: SufS family cysteine desulfurase [Terrimicrobiaceae bacterium]